MHTGAEIMAVSNTQT